MAMNKALVGREYTKLAPFAITAEAARAYADATDADIAAYEGAEAIAPPMYGVAFSMPALGAPLFDPEAHVDMMRLVHGDQDMRFVAPVRPGDVVVARSRVIDIVEKSSGEIFNVGITATNQRGEVVLEAKSGLFIRGSRKPDVVTGEKKERDVEAQAWDGATPAWSETKTVSADQSRRYAEPSGDRNPIHTDEEVARLAGLPGIILHGLCTMAFVHNACVRQLGGAPGRVKRLAVRFARPVLMGDILTIEARDANAERRWLLRVTNQAGVVVITDGAAELA